MRRLKGRSGTGSNSWGKAQHGSFKYNYTGDKCVAWAKVNLYFRFSAALSSSLESEASIFFMEFADVRHSPEEVMSSFKGVAKHSKKSAMRPLQKQQ